MGDSISITGPCACGFSSSQPNYDCERCRLVWFVRKVKEMRDSQNAYFKQRTGDRLDHARNLEAIVDNLTFRFLERCMPTLFAESDDRNETYFSKGG